jgi:hypothetical protein
VTNSSQPTPPQPIPEHLIGDQWRFASIAAGDLEQTYRDRPIPIVQVPEALLPINLGLASSQRIPGVIIDGGRMSMRLAQWIGSVGPASLRVIFGPPDGLLLWTRGDDRWVLATFADPDVQQAGQIFRDRQEAAQGLHFLLVQPDDSGVTCSGIWLLQRQ